MQRSQQILALDFLMRHVEKEMRNCDRLAAKKRQQAKAYHQSGQMERARMCAQTSCDRRNEATDYMRLSHQLESVRQKYQRAMTMTSVAGRMDGINQGIGLLTQAVTPLRMLEIASDLERNLEDLRVADQAVSDQVEFGVARDAACSQVDELLAEIASENGQEMREQLQSMRPPPAASEKRRTAAPSKTAAKERAGPSPSSSGGSSSSSSSSSKRVPRDGGDEDDVTRRLKELRRPS